MKIRTQSELINTDLYKIADTVRMVFENTASEYGQEYFKQMVLQLANSLGADYAFIGELDKDKINTIDTLALSEKGKIIENISYQLKNTPCENVVGKSPCFYPIDVVKQFPQDEFLKINSIESYIGIPLFNSKNEAIGLIVCMFLQAVKSPILVQDVIQIFSSRVSSEIERVHLESKLRRSENRFRHIAENTAAWIWEIDPQGKYIYTSKKVNEILGYHPSELIGKRYFYESYPEPNIEAYKKTIFSLFNKRKAFTDFENQKLHKNGEIVWFRTFGVPIINPEGELLGYRGTSINISEQKKHEQEIQKQNEFLTTVLNSLSYPFHVINVKDYSVSLSNHAGAISNNTQKSTCYKLSHKLETPCCGTEHPCPLKIVMDTKKSCIVEHIHTNKEGVKYPCEVHCHPIFDKQGNVSQVIEYSIDRTEREQSKWTITQRVKELQCIHQLTQALEKHKNHPDDNCNKVVDVIPSGFQYPEITGCSIIFYGIEYKTDNYCNGPWMLESPLHNGKKLVGKVQVCFNQESDTNPFLKEENDLLKTIGQHLSSFIEQQHYENLQNVIYKISEAANISENLHDLIGIIHLHLKSLIDTSNFYMALYHEQNDYFTVPYSADKKINFRSFPAGKSLTKYVLLQQCSKLVTSKILNQLEDNGEVISVGERSKAWLGVPLLIKGKAIGVISIQNYLDVEAYDLKDLDILEFVSNQISISVQRKKVEDDLKKALLKAQESDRLKTAFLSAMSHELRTPLNAIIGFSGLINEELKKEETIEFAQLINQSGNDLLGIINNILDVTQLEGRNITTNITQFQAHDLCLNLLDKLHSEQYQNNYKKIIINFKPSLTDQDISILSDQDKLFKILYNLLSNAIKFTPEGEVALGYLIENRENMPYVKFFIKDSGIGISHDKQNIIFNLFRQEDDSQARKFGGTGVGLSLAKKYTELLNGHIEVESEVNKGSEFTVWIPLEPDLILSN
ncbi:sensor histidine kinase [Ancylomarina euxinus]|nr:PAS domain S-box protein [Ancylomarina euxinus]MCZ4694973.1 ATP-binding protein [Ancylomarina euxinus]